METVQPRDVRDLATRLVAESQAMIRQGRALRTACRERRGRLARAAAFPTAETK